MVFIILVVYFKTEKTKNKNNEIKENLAYDGLLVEDLIKKDTDLDGIPDWEESLYGMDVTNNDTDGDGVLDFAEISQLKSEDAKTEENLTETDKFSRELFATVAALNQAGEVDQNTIDKLTTSLSEKMGDLPVKKVFLISDIKVMGDDSTTSIQKYNSALGALYKKYTTKDNVTEILKEFVNDGEEVNMEALVKLNPIIKQSEEVIKGMLTITTPPKISQAHLDLINALERSIENLSDIQLYDKDPIIAINAMGKFEENINQLELSMNKLSNLIK